AGGGPRHGHDGSAAAPPGGAAARGERHPGRHPGRDRDRHRGRDDRGGDRRRRARRLHLPRRRDGRQRDHPRRRAPRRRARDRGRRGARRPRAAAPPATVMDAAARAAALVLVLLAACGGAGDRVRVGGKNFTEQRILGELVAQTLEAAGLPVERRLDLGGTFVCDAALRAGQIDVYVEYTGTALAAVLKEPPGDPATVWARVAAAYARDGLVWTR